MKWNLSWLMKQKDGRFTFSEDLAFSQEAFRNVHSLLDLKDIHVEGNGYFDIQTQRVTLQIKVKGTMILACAVSLEEVPYPFETESTEIFSFVKVKPEEDVHEAKKNTIDITPIVFQNIVMEVPSRVVKDGAKLKPSGNGWKVISGCEEVDKLDIDPRLAKLKDYFKESN